MAKSNFHQLWDAAIFLDLVSLIFTPSVNYNIHLGIGFYCFKDVFYMMDLI